jgi:hypothetical protein
MGRTIEELARCSAIVRRGADEHQASREYADTSASLETASLETEQSETLRGDAMQSCLLYTLDELILG